MKLKRTPAIKTIDRVVKDDKTVLGVFIATSVLVGLHLVNKLRNDEMIQGAVYEQAYQDQKSEREKKEA